MSIGVDIGLFNNRIELAYDFYNKNKAEFDVSLLSLGIH